jgi:thiol:disulfide interchange protein
VREPLRSIASGVLSFAPLLLATTAFAESGAPAGPHVSASLIAETKNIVPGQPLHLALRQHIQDGWHTYWSNPGESGLPTMIDWSLPIGFSAEPISWPIPERFTAGPVVGYGYKHDVILPVTIDVPAGLQPGSIVMLSAHASWLACSDICVPEDVKLSLSVPVGTTLEGDSDWTEAFATARAQLPTSNPFRTTATASTAEVILRIATGDATRLRNVTFFPADADVIDSEAAQSVVANSEELVVKLRRDTTKSPPSQLNGVLTFTDLAAQGVQTTGAISISAPIGSPTSNGYPLLAFVAAVLLAFAGGIVLNLMPCVLPVLSIKVLALVRHTQSTTREIRLQGLAYAAGVLASFAIIGGVLIGLRSAGAEIGWGFQLQSPIVVGLMVYLLFAVGLSLSGVFEIGGRMTAIGGDLASRKGYSGSFFTGALATLVATPCTGPFMAASIGYAITQPWYVSLAVLEAVGAGLAFPYVLIAFSPRARGALPKPGVWMVRLKEILAFPVYGTAVWLMYVLSQQVDAAETIVALAGLVLIAFSAWLYNAVYLNDGLLGRWGVGLSALSVAGAMGLLFLIGDEGGSRGAPIATGERQDWQPFSLSRLETLRAEGRAVFVDFTAAWCITCKVNERIALGDGAVIKAFADGGVATLRADWTRQDVDITRMLEANGRAGVPLYLFYPRAGATGERKSPIILPQLLTASSVLHEVRQD